MLQMRYTFSLLYKALWKVHRAVYSIQQVNGNQTYTPQANMTHWDNVLYTLGASLTHGDRSLSHTLVSHVEYVY